MGSNCQDPTRAYAYSTYGSYQCYGALVALIAILQYTHVQITLSDFVTLELISWHRIKFLLDLN